MVLFLLLGIFGIDFYLAYVCGISVSAGGITLLCIYGLHHTGANSPELFSLKRKGQNGDFNS
jgi:hypothetical protein